MYTSEKIRSKEQIHFHFSFTIILQQPCALLGICEYQSHPKVERKNSSVDRLSFTKDNCVVLL